MAEQQTELGNWVDQLITTIFFQPDDDVSKNAMQNGFSPDLKICINGNHIPADEYKKLILATRATNDLEVLNTRELLASNGAGNGDTGTVGHLSTFKLTDKKTGAAQTESSLTIATVDSKDGKRILKELAEVYHAQE
ncbi:hypothetical protein Plec18170_006103 [Paecilomyces lecythidis]